MLRFSGYRGCCHLQHSPRTFLRPSQSCKAPHRHWISQVKTQARCLASDNGSARPKQNGFGVPWLSNLSKWPDAPNGHVKPSASESTLLPTDLDAIVLLAGGLTDTGECPPWVTRRLDTAAHLWGLQSNPSCPIVCLGGGTPHKPPVLKPDGYVIHESTSCAIYLMQQGVPATSILKETSSYDTVGNAYFALTIHAIPAGWRRVAVVTSDFHMPRTQALVTTMWGLAARHVLNDPDRYTLWFASSTDEGLWPDDVLAIRRDKEMQAVHNWRKASAAFNSFTDLHTWLYATHQCYSVSRQHEDTTPTITDPRLLASY